MLLTEPPPSVRLEAVLVGCVVLLHVPEVCLGDQGILLGIPFIGISSPGGRGFRLREFMPDPHAAGDCTPNRHGDRNSGGRCLQYLWRGDNGF
jgi:hypothetical protein